MAQDIADHRHTSKRSDVTSTAGSAGGQDSVKVAYAMLRSIRRLQSEAGSHVQVRHDAKGALPRPLHAISLPPETFPGLPDATDGFGDDTRRPLRALQKIDL